MRSRRLAVSLSVAVVGVFVSWAGQGVWRQSPDELWAAIGVVSLLSAVAISAAPSISRMLEPVTTRLTSR